MKHFLRTLGADDNANWLEIVASYRDQVRVWHPDRFLNDKRMYKKAEEETKQIHYALRRLKELREDLENAKAFDENAPFLVQYYKITEGKGNHGSITKEDRHRGYIHDSFGQWDSIASTLGQSLRQKTSEFSYQLRRSRRKHRTRKTTIRISRSKKTKVRNFMITSALAISLASIGAINIPKMLKDDPQRTKAETQSTDPDLFITDFLDEPSTQFADQQEGERGKGSAADKSSRPEIVRAAMDCNSGELKKLIDAGHSINQADASGQTALIWAAKRNCRSAVELLMIHGANIKLRSTNGFTAHQWAKWYRNEELAQIIAK